ncbi:TnsA-like heteromeric transposase endonuclease subunit [Streptomyces tunisiensis]|uniref:TnsA-like heteromeric transposase endonuclease subunit n=1 Tax=Streptomyces tunisiensis TaxID=948699 RepID=A0ABP7YZ36_9ACTN
MADQATVENARWGPVSTTDLAASVQVSVRQADECVVEDLEWASAPLDLLRHAQPWRTFRWYKGQQHYSGTYWAATVRDHVIYESRLELARLLFADFAPDVRHVVAQPFLLKAVVEGRLRRHIPDYLLLTDDGPVVVDVKPRHRLERPKVAFTFAWTRAAVASRGWRYEVWSEPDPHELENVRFLAGYRRHGLFDPGLLDGLRACELEGLSLGEAFRLLPDRPRPLVKSAVLHLLWSGHVTTELDRPLSPGHVLRRSA